MLSLKSLKFLRLFLESRTKESTSNALLSGLFTIDDNN